MLDSGCWTHAMLKAIISCILLQESGIRHTASIHYI